MRALMKPGMTFEEFGHAAPKLPAEYKNGRYGVKLEDQVLATKDGAIPLSTYTFEAKLLA